MIELLRPETINQGLVALSLAIPILGMALSQRQREAIRDERDHGKCQFPARHKCNGWGINKSLNVHHITGQLYSQVALGQSEKDYDVPENVLTICTNSHMQKIHTDQTEMNGKSYQNGEFSRLQGERERLSMQGVKYWNTMYDSQMQQKARQLTEEAKKKGWTFPEVNHR